MANKIQARLALGEFDIETEKRAREEKTEPTFKEYADSWMSTIAPAGPRSNKKRANLFG